MTTKPQDLEHRATGSVVSRDGTRIGYRRMGSGPGVVLIQGAMGTEHNFSELAAQLADEFTIYLPDRRGRGLSPRPYHPDYTVTRDVEDLEALIDVTGADRVFGLSAGAIIALWSASSCGAINKVAAFEPPFVSDQRGADDAMARFDGELQRGDLAAAAITGMLAAQMAPPLMTRLPRWPLELMAKVGLWIESKRRPGEYAPMRELIPALRYDFAVVSQTSRELAGIANIECDVLLLGAEKSPSYLSAGLDAVAELLPQARRITLPGVSHGAAWNANRGGKPQAVVPVLRSFFE